MRTQQGALTRYQPAQVPSDASALQEFLRNEFQKLAEAISAVADGQYDVTHVEPGRPREGMVRFADGSDWDPGSGRGFYGFSNGAWRFLG